MYDLVRRRRVATFQFFWLLVCFTVFLYFGYLELERASKNVRANYKPLTMNNVIDYGIPGENQYVAPDIMLRVYMNSGDAVNVTNMTESIAIGILEEMFGLQGEKTIHEEQQKPFDVYCLYESESANFDILNKSGWFGMADLRYNISFALPLGNEDNSFIGGITIKLDEPDPTKGPWMCGLFIDLSNDTQSVNASIQYIQLAVDRGMSDVPFDSLHRVFRINGDGEDYFTYRFSEKETKLINGDMLYYFKDRFSTDDESWFYDFGVLGTMVIVQIVPDLRIETWEEFIEYDYMDWVLAMGGMVSWMSIIFFWGAYYISVCLDSESMTLGILPLMSFIFANAEEVQWMKYQLKKLGILSSRTARRSSTLFQIPTLRNRPKVLVFGA